MIPIYRRRWLNIQSLLCVVVLASRITLAQAQPQTPPLMGYTPITNVTYQSTIDVDQQQIENLLSQITGSNTQQDQTFIDQANEVYTQRLRTLSSADGTEFLKPSNTNEFLSFFYLYLEYMGDSDFAHDFINAGFNDAATTSGYSGNFKLVEYSFPGGLQNVVQVGTIVLTLLQYVIRNLDVAIEECAICSNTNDVTSDCGLSLIDEAAAYYVGSLQSTVSNSYEGFLLYGAADRWCQLFNTCDGTITFNDATITTSRVNMIVMQQLLNLQSNVQSRSCNPDDATITTFRNIIVSQLFVPIIQGLIRSVYYTEQSVVSDFCDADATMYAAAILPLVLNCTGDDDAELLFDHTRPDRTVPTNATLVHEILKRNYDCLGISSSDIGTFNPDVMVEWGRCGQPTPAPVVSKPTTPAPSSGTIVATTTPTQFVAPIQEQPVATPTTSSGWTLSDGTILIAVVCNVLVTALLWL